MSQIGLKVGHLGKPWSRSDLGGRLRGLNRALSLDGQLNLAILVKFDLRRILADFGEMA